MIGYLKGKILEVTSDSALIDVNGVGYEVLASSSNLAEMQNSLGTIELWIHTHVREDALVLFGFSNKLEREMFHSLLKVNGIGPKLAINALSGATPDQIIEMIELEDVKALSKLPKVGKKTAEQMILTLKGKLVISARDSESKSPTLAPRHKELTSALVNLGFRLQEVEKVVSTLPKDLDLQEGLRQGLAALTSI